MSFICARCKNPTDNETIIGDVTVHFCDACNKQLHREVTWESEGEQYLEKTVICPYCEHEYEMFDAYELESDEEIECECCGKKFDLEVREVRLFTTKRSLCEMPKDWGA